MANANKSVRVQICILKVDIKCCTRCQNKASLKLQSISGVSAVEYNEVKGLMTVTGDMDPMALVNKLTKSGRKTEIISIKHQLDDLTSDSEEDTSSAYSSSPDLKTMERQTLQQQQKKKKNQSKAKSFLLKCLGKKSSKPPPMVNLPFAMQNRNSNFPSRFDPNGPASSFPFANATTSQRWPGPPMHPMHSVGLRPPMMHPMHNAGPPMMMHQQQHPQMPPMMMGPAMPYHHINMYRPAPQQTLPYFKTRQGQSVNPLHYPQGK